MQIISLNVVKCSDKLFAQRNFGTGVIGWFGEFYNFIGFSSQPYPLGYKPFNYSIKIKEQAFYQNLPLNTLRADLYFRKLKKA